MLMSGKFAEPTFLPCCPASGIESDRHDVEHTKFVRPRSTNPLSGSRDESEQDGPG